MSKRLNNNMKRIERQVFSERLVSGQRVVYEKDSMDRLGDDLTAVTTVFMKRSYNA